MHISENVIFSVIGTLSLAIAKLWYSQHKESIECRSDRRKLWKEIERLKGHTCSVSVCSSKIEMPINVKKPKGVE